MGWRFCVFKLIFPFDAGVGGALVMRQNSCQNPKRQFKNTGVEGKIRQNVGIFF
jgi:hypothetical protein